MTKIDEAIEYLEDLGQVHSTRHYVALVGVRVSAPRKPVALKAHAEPSLSPLQEKAIVSIALGLPLDRVAKRFDVTESTVQSWFRCKLFKDRMERALKQQNGGV